MVLSWVLPDMNISRRGFWRTLATIIFAGGAKSLLGQENTVRSPGDNQAQTAGEPTRRNDRSEDAGVARPRFREGTRVSDLVGIVRQTGQRYTFFVEAEGSRFVLLENLMLERIMRSQASHPGIVQWKVSGTVTEFQGQNYLLIEHALLRGGAFEEAKPATPQKRN